MLYTSNYKFRILEDHEKFKYDVTSDNLHAIDTLLKEKFDEFKIEIDSKMPKGNTEFAGTMTFNWENVTDGMTFITDSGVAYKLSVVRNSDGSRQLKFNVDIATTGALVAGGNIYENGQLLSDRYAAKSHTHAYVAKTGDTMSGNLNVPSIYADNWFRSNGQTGWYNESYGGGIYMIDSTWVRTYNNKAFYVNNDITASGTITGSKVVNAVWNDYAEYFPKEEGYETEPGDIIMLDIENDKEIYVKATMEPGEECVVVGVHSDTYGHLIGGDTPPNENVSLEEYNKDKFIPVGLAGRVCVKFTGSARKGAKVVPSKIPGVGRTYISGLDDPSNIVGILVETDNLTDVVRRLKMKIV